jgi:hypothetical protein
MLVNQQRTRSEEARSQPSLDGFRLGPPNSYSKAKIRLESATHTFFTDLDSFKNRCLPIEFE